MEIKYFDLSKDEIEVQGKPLSAIIEKVGTSPFYLYDRSIVLKKISELKNHFNRSIKIHYALKANPMEELINFLADKVDGFDVSSLNELELGLKSGMAATNISFAGPGKTEKELSHAIRSRVLINIESENEFKRVHQLSRTMNLIPRLGLRVNTEFEMKSSGMKMSGGPKPFGIDSELVPQMIETIQQHGYSIEGLHFYSGSQCLDAATLVECQNLCLKFAQSLSAQFKDRLQIMNLGGGFGIPYFEHDQILEISEISKNLNDQTSRFKNEFPQASFILELGRYIVGEAGLYIATIVDKKVSRGKTYLVLDGGMNHHLAASGNLGQIIKKNYPIKLLKGLKSSLQEKVTIVGPLCTPLDQLASDILISPSQIGDRVIIFQSGAYGLSASPQDFLSHEKIQEILY